MSETYCIGCQKIYEDPRFEVLINDYGDVINQEALCPECLELLELGRAVMGMEENTDLERNSGILHRKKWSVDKNRERFYADTPLEALKAAKK